jgi:hypothetical protein
MKTFLTILHLGVVIAPGIPFHGPLAACYEAAQDRERFQAQIEASGYALGSVTLACVRARRAPRKGDVSLDLPHTRDSL